ncbi:glutathione S-transferase theta-1-like [Palaemon carinicauda]|uniref:glutathione S-transferase theta-1-like n=1 Tax=Palaemon carinicauda TaxID=392227 RepID=UPI0035B5921F
MAPTLDIYVNYLSQPSRSVGLLCKAINAPHTEHQMDLMKKEHKTPDFLRINPFGRVPSVTDENITINESCSALRYIASKYDKTGQWYPQELDLRVKVDEYLDWQHTNTRKHGVGYFFNLVFAPKFTQKPADWDLINEHKTELARVEKEFNSYFLASKPFIVGDHVTIADLAAACEFEQPQAAGYELSQPVTEYLKRVKAALGPCYEELHKVLYDMMKK